MDKLKMHSPNFVDQNIGKLAELFPNCVTESKNSKGEITRSVDFDQLKQEFSGSLIEGGKERFQLDWPGKRSALLTANSPLAKSLRPDLTKSIDFERTKNIFIEGDNLDALKLIQETYLSKVKMIYIDPPYNTGRDFIYADDFTESVDSFRRKSDEVDESGNRLVSNTDSNGRFHSDWLSMMYSRLKLARNLLRDDGCIFISIDDNEIHTLRMICDEVFGSNNFIATIIWHKMDSPKNSAKYLSEDHDYIVLYAKNAEIWRPNLLPRSGKMEDRYQNHDDDPRGPWLLGDLAARNFYSKGQYSITTPTGKTIDGPPAGSYWRISKEKFEELDKDNRIWWGKSGDNRPGVKKFLSEVRDGVIPQTYWHWKDVGSTRNAKQELSKLMEAASGDQLFVTPKPVRLIERMLHIATSSEEEDIVMDFFAGSGSTAHAVYSKNKEDAGNRRWISVQLPEKAGDDATLVDMALDRIQRASNSVMSDIEVENKDLFDSGYRFFNIDSSNLAEIFYNPDEILQNDLFSQVDTIKEDRSKEDLLFQVMLDWGVDLSLPIRTIDVENNNVFTVDGNALIACFDSTGGITESLVKEICRMEPLRVVFRDKGFVGDDAKINVEQIFKQLSPHTDVKTI